MDGRIQQKLPGHYTSLHAYGHHRGYELSVYIAFHSLTFRDRRGRHTTDAPRSSIPRRHAASNVGNILPQGRYGRIIIGQPSSLTNAQSTALLQTSSIVHYLLTSARSLVLSILLEATVVLISTASRIDPSFWPYIVKRRTCDILTLSWY